VPFFPSISGHRWSLPAFVPVALVAAVWALVGSPAGARVQPASTPLLGDQTVEANVEVNSAGRAEAFRFTAAATGAAAGARIYLDASNSARTVLVGVYNNAGGRPGSLLWSGVVAAPRRGAWNLVVLRPRSRRAASGPRPAERGRRPRALVTGRTYWLAVLAVRGRIAFRDRQNCARSLSSAQRRLKRLPRSWRAGATSRTCSISAYLTAVGRETPTSRPAPAPVTSGGSAPGRGPTRSTNCAPQPRLCGYPDPGFSWAVQDGAWAAGGGGVGPNSGGVSEACSSLPASGSITTSSDNQTIQNLDITGQVIVHNAHVTIDNVCISMPGGGSSCTNSAGAGDTQCWAMILQDGASGTRVSNSSIGGANPDSASVVGIAQGGTPDPDPVFSHDYVYDCSECFHGNAWTVIDSYVIANGINGAHGETVYMNGGSFTGSHDVFLLPSGNSLSSANLFGDVNGGEGGGCQNRWAVKNSLLSDPGRGGIYVLWLCSNSSSQGSAVTDFESDDFATPGSQGIVGATTLGQAHGGLGAYCGGATWLGNFHDLDGSPVLCG
jgi:hypothetical protein